MTTTSQLPDVIDYLVATAQSSPLLGASPLAPVRVIDGPPPTGDQLAEQRLLYIGHNPKSPQEASSDGAQAWPVLDYARTKDEDAPVLCAADAWTGSQVMKGARDACAAIVAGVELLLRGSPDQGGPGDASMGGIALWSGVDAMAWYERQTTDGAGCLCVFTVVYKARLTTS